jgi:RNA polymerase sigma-70 factor, ECF subfamily
LQPSAQEFKALVALYRRSVYNHSLRVLGNAEDAEEATQDVFLAIQRSMQAFEGRSTASSWIHGITFRICSHYRQRKRLEIVPLDDDLEELADPSTDPELLLHQKDTREQVDRLISCLPEKAAEAIALYCVEGASYKEIADVLNVPEGTVATLIHRGRLRITAMLQSGYAKQDTGGRPNHEKRGGPLK